LASNQIGSTNSASTAAGVGSQPSSVNASPAEQQNQVEDLFGPSTSHNSGATQQLPIAKRKDPNSTPANDESAKRRKFDIGVTTSSNHSRSTSTSSAFEMIEARQPAFTVDNSIATTTTTNKSTTTTESSPQSPNYSANHQFVLPMGNSNGSPTTELVSADRLILWNQTAQSVEQNLQRFLVATTSNMSNSHILVRIYHRLNGSSVTVANNGSNHLLDHAPHVRPSPLPQESRRRALSQDNSATSDTQEGANLVSSNVEHNGRSRQAHLNYASPNIVNPTGGVSLDASVAWQRQPHLHVYQTRGSGQHLWFNQWTIPLPVSNSNYRIQCWNFSVSTIPNIKDSQTNIVTQKCRIHNDASIDISSGGGLIACLVPKDDGACMPSFDLKIFSLRSFDFGACYYQVPHGPNAISVSLSPSGGYAVVGLASNKFISSDPTDDDLTIAKVFKLYGGKNSSGYVRDIKIKRDDSSFSLNAIRWMSRGIIYNVGPQHHQRHQATRMRNRVA